MNDERHTIEARLTLKGVEYVSVKFARELIGEHGCDKCPFVHLRCLASTCPYFWPTPWAPELSCGAGHWMPLEAYLKHKLAGDT